MLNGIPNTYPGLVGVRDLSKNALLGYLLGFFLYLYAGSQFYSNIVGIEVFPTRNIILIGLTAFLVELVFFQRTHALVYVIFSVVLIGYFVSGLYLGRATIGDASLILGNTGMMLILLRRRIFVPVAYLMFLGLAGYFFYSAGSGVTPDDVTAGSRNGVSWTMIEAAVLLYIVLDKEKKKISLLPAIITLPLCVWATGRSGIVSSSLLVLGVAFFYFRQNRVVLAALALIPVALLARGVLLPFLDLLGDYLLYFETWGADPRDRDVHIAYYWNRLDATSLLLGQDLTRDSYWQLWGLNPHNSYLFMHSWLGFAAFILIGLILGAVVRSFFCAKKIYGLLLVVLLLRAATDPLFFLSTFDFLVYYLVVRIYGEPAPAIGRMWSAVAYRVPKTP